MVQMRIGHNACPRRHEKLASTGTKDQFFLDRILRLAMGEKLARANVNDLISVR